MPVVSITRIKPADLQEVQVQANVGVEGLISDVIKALQSNVSTQQAPLNTSCPTCAVNGTPKGFLSRTVGSTTFKVPCYTCKGYLLYHTADGQVTPPTNPFNAPISVTRMLPADLVEITDSFNATTKLSQAITALQSNFNVVPANACPKCANGNQGVSTGWITISASKCMCDLCVGVQKTVSLYQMVNGLPVVVPPQVSPPNPLSTPDIPQGATLTRMP